jgi:Putative addiction module component
MVGVSAESM